jgi:hypothetical protein
MSTSTERSRTRPSHHPSSSVLWCWTPSRGNRYLSASVLNSSPPRSHFTVQKYPTTPHLASPEIAYPRPSAQITRPCHPTSPCLTLQILRNVKYIRVLTSLYAPDCRGLVYHDLLPGSFPRPNAPIILSSCRSCRLNVTCMAKNTWECPAWKSNVDDDTSYLLLMPMLQSK